MKQPCLLLLIAALLITTLSFGQAPPPAPGNNAGSRRASIAPGGTLEFKQLRIAVLAIRAVDSTAGSPRYVARIRVQEGGAAEEMTIDSPPESFNWHGYHVAIPSVHGPGEPGGGRVELAVTTIASLPQCVGKPIGKDSPWPCR
jgi:hypothetical protein